MTTFALGVLAGLTLGIVGAALPAWLLAQRKAPKPEPTLPSGLPAEQLLALRDVTIKAIMVPRSHIQGINLAASPQGLIEQLRTSNHTRLPLYREDINQIEGVLHIRNATALLAQADDLSAAKLLAAGRPPYFVPESTPLLTQLANFQKEQRRIGIVVDEYGEVIGLVSLEDIFQELIGELGSLEDFFPNPDIQIQDDGSYQLAGGVHIRELNRTLGWHLPSDGPQTLGGLITEALEQIPDCAVCLKVGPYRLEVVETSENRVLNVRAWRAESRR
jgi:Mg2+/Co2+ transporter CorB